MANAGDLTSAAGRSAGDDHHALSEESRVTRRYDTAELPPGLSPRLLSREQAAAYCGVSPTHFTETIGTEVRPVRVRSAVRWDRVALDRWIDRQMRLYNADNRQRSIAERLNGDPCPGSEGVP